MVSTGFDVSVTRLTFQGEDSNVENLCLTHLAKRPSDLKQNGTHEKTQFSGTAFHTISHGVLRFVASVSFKNVKRLSKNFNQSKGGFLS